MVSIIALILTITCWALWDPVGPALCRVGGGSRGPAGSVSGDGGGEFVPPLTLIVTWVGDAE